MPVYRNGNKLRKPQGEQRRYENGENDGRLQITGVGVPLTNGTANRVHSGKNVKASRSPSVVRRGVKQKELQKFGHVMKRNTGGGNSPGEKCNGCSSTTDQVRTAGPTKDNAKSIEREKLKIIDLFCYKNKYYSLCQDHFKRRTSTLTDVEKVESCFRTSSFCGGVIGQDGGYLQITDKGYTTTLCFPKGAVNDSADVTMLVLSKQGYIHVNGYGGEQVLKIAMKFDFGSKHNELETPALLFVRFTHLHAKAQANCIALDDNGKKTETELPSHCGKIQSEAGTTYFVLVLVQQRGSYDLVVTTPGDGNTHNVQQTSTSPAGGTQSTPCSSSSFQDQDLLRGHARAPSGGANNADRLDVMLESRPRKPIGDHRAGVFTREEGGAVQLRVRIWKDDKTAEKNAKAKEQMLGSVMADDDRRICVMTDIDVTMTVHNPEWKLTEVHAREQTKKISLGHIPTDSSSVSCSFLAERCESSRTSRPLTASILLSNNGDKSSRIVEFTVLVGSAKGASCSLQQDQGIDAMFREMYIDLKSESRMKIPLENRVLEQLCVILDTENSAGTDIRSLANMIGIQNDTVNYFTNNVVKRHFSLSYMVIITFFLFNSNRAPGEVVRDLQRHLEDMGATAAAALLDTDSASENSAPTDSQTSASALWSGSTSIDSELSADSNSGQSLVRLREVDTPDSGINGSPTPPPDKDKERPAKDQKIGDKARVGSEVADTAHR